MGRDLLHYCKVLTDGTIRHSFMVKNNYVIVYHYVMPIFSSIWHDLAGGRATRGTEAGGPQGALATQWWGEAE